MKKIVITAILVMLAYSCFSQFNAYYQVGDTLYYANNKITFLKTNTFVIIKEINVAENSNSFIVDKFLKNAKTDSYILDSKFTTNGLQELRSNGVYTSYHKNGKIASKGETINGKRGGELWKYWYENGAEKSEEKLSKETFFNDKKATLIINFWDEKGVKTVENGNGYAQFISEEDGFLHKGSYKAGLKNSLWTASAEGSKIYEEIYKKGKVVKGTSWNQEKQSFKYKKVFTEAYYKKEGSRSVRKYISRKFNTNTYGVKGAVFVAFLVDKQGEVKNVNIIRGISSEYDAELKRILSGMSGWTPAKKRGQIMESTYSLSLNFKG
jgi:antitoxin component YwqK of YwqJK toxin-antitoxin module